jgi:hypothetical protein
VLVENGVDPRDRDMEGYTSLEKAEMQNNVETERYLQKIVALAEEGKIQF